MRLAVVVFVLVSLFGCQRSPGPRSSTVVPLPAGTEPASDGAARVEPSLEPAAVVELFTSEGCSSCPSAERFAESLDEQAERVGLRVFVLAYHVDYWNDLGHVDRFSAPRFTERQRWYALGWGTTRAYTPQLVIGGTRDISGNDRRNAILAVSEQLDRPAEVGIAMSVDSEGDEARVRYHIEPAHPDDYLTVALVQDEASTEVEVGENAGRTLQHVNVVRDVALSRVGTGSGTWTVEVPGDMPSGSVVGFVQEQRSRRVLGVSELRL